jgi:hypothetical protein
MMLFLIFYLNRSLRLVLAVDQLSTKRLGLLSVLCWAPGWIIALKVCVDGVLHRKLYLKSVIFSELAAISAHYKLPDVQFAWVER